MSNLEEEEEEGMEAEELLYSHRLRVSEVVDKFH